MGSIVDASGSLLNSSPRLPFINDNDCGLGIAVRTYLDDLLHQNNPTSAEARAEVKSKGKEWFQHSESFTANLDSAFQLWDAVSRWSSLSFQAIADLSIRSTRGRRAPAKSSRTRNYGRMRTSGWLRDGDGGPQDQLLTNLQTIAIMPAGQVLRFLIRHRQCHLTQCACSLSALKRDTCKPCISKHKKKGYDCTCGNSTSAISS